MSRSSNIIRAEGAIIRPIIKPRVPPKTSVQQLLNGIIPGWLMRALTVTLFSGREYAVTQSADYCSLSVSVAIGVNATAAQHAERQPGADSDITPTAGINKLSKVEKRTVTASGVIASG